MLTGSKYTAMINNYSDYKETQHEMEQLAAINLFDFAIQNKLNSIENSNQTIDEKKLQLELLSKLKVPNGLKIFCFENGDTRYQIND